MRACSGSERPRCRRPKPWRKLGGGARGSPVSDSKPSSPAAPPSSTALTSAPLGAKPAPELALPPGYQPPWKYCRTSAAEAAISGVAIDVPSMYLCSRHKCISQA
jgi:hypothetical protein